MARALRTTLIGAALLLTIAGTLFILFRTPPGHALLKPIIARALGDVLGGDVAIGAIRGAPPGDLVLEDVRMTDGGDEWLSLDRAEIHWRPLALLGGRVEVRTVAIDGVTLLKAPPRKDNKDRSRGFELPERLPDVVVLDLTITDFRVSGSLTGAPVRLDAAGRAQMGGAALDITFNASGSDEGDFVAVRILRDGDALGADVTVASKADGAIATITGVGGAIYLDAKGSGRLAAYRLAIDGDLGAYGSLAGVLSGDLERMERIDFNADVTFGERLTTLSRVIGPVAHAEGWFLPRADGGAVTIAQFQSALGAISGAVDWRNRNKALATVNVVANARFAPDWRPDLRRYLGAHASLKAKVTPGKDIFAVNAAFNAELLQGAAEAIHTNLQTSAVGDVDIMLSTNEHLPAPLRKGAKASGRVDFDFRKGVSSQDFLLTTAEGGAFKGAASWEFDTKAFAAKGDITAPPAMIAALSRKLAAERAASADIDIKGTPEEFSGTIVATTPLLLYDRRPLPASRIAIAFTGAPSAPAGEISARALDGSRRLKSNFARTNEYWRIGGLDYAGRDFALKGSAAFNPSSNEGAVDLVYSGGDGAEPWPGVMLSGAMTAKGSITRGASANNLVLRADSLRTGSITLTRFKATATGPADRLAVKASADELAIAGAAPITGLSSVMTLRNGGVDVTSLTATIAGAPLTLSERARVQFSEGVSIETLRARIGQRGSLAFDGAFADARWRGVLSLRRAPIVGAASVIDLDIALDTQKSPLATGAFALTSLLTQTETTSLAGAFRWDGRSLSIADDGRSEAVDLDLSLPARLVRSPKLEIDSTGPLTGAFRYRGRAESVAAFLPPALQSIEGDLAFDGAAAGSLASPKLTGALEITDGAYTELASGFSIIGIEGTARADSASSRIDFSLTGSGTGQTAKTIAANGYATLGDSARLSSDIVLTRARIAAGPVSTVEATGNISLGGPFDSLTAEGDIAIRDLSAEVVTPERTGLVDITVVAVDQGDGAPSSVQRSSALETLTYDLRIKGSEGLVIKGRGLESEWRADVHVVGRADAPVVLGVLTLEEGTIDFASRRFAMTRGSIDFDRLSPNNPSLDLRAERETESGTTAVIVIKGRAEAPRITLESTPALPQEDIMALVLFDKPATELSALQSLQVAEGLAELGGIGPFGGKGLTGATRQALGLDMFNLDLDEADSAASTLTVGKYVADDLFVSATQDARGQNGSLRIEYEIIDNLTVETELRQDGDQTVSANWKHDF